MTIRLTTTACTVTRGKLMAKADWQNDRQTLAAMMKATLGLTE